MTIDYFSYNIYLSKIGAEYSVQSFHTLNQNIIIINGSGSIQSMFYVHVLALIISNMGILVWKTLSP